MSNRKFERIALRRLYDEFTARWNEEKRMSGQYGNRGRKPTFNQWVVWKKQQDEKAKTTEVQYELPIEEDPWDETPRTPVAPEEKRGVLTIPISGDTEE